MRERRFRIWDKQNKRMFHDALEYELAFIAWEHDWPEDEPPVKQIGFGLYEQKKRFVVMESLMGVDCKNDEVFEDDIVEFNGSIGVLVFGTYECDTAIDMKNSSHTYTLSYYGWHFKPFEEQYDGETQYIMQSDLKYMRVIGNIHESLDLLKELEYVNTKGEGNE